MRQVQTPAFRATDPVTSELAAEQITNCGARAHQQRQAAAAVLNHPGRTSSELAQLTGLDRYALARRLPECETAGAVCKGIHRECSVSGRQAVTWLPVLHGARIAA